MPEFSETLAYQVRNGKYLFESVCNQYYGVFKKIKCVLCCPEQIAERIFQISAHFTAYFEFCSKVFQLFTYLRQSLCRYRWKYIIESFFYRQDYLLESVKSIFESLYQCRTSAHVFPFLQKTVSGVGLCVYESANYITYRCPELFSLFKVTEYNFPRCSPA